MLVSKYGKVKSQRMIIQIADPNRQTLYRRATYQRICEFESYDPTQELAAAKPRKTHSKTNLRPRSLRSRTQEQEESQVLTVGRRETNEIDLGVMGNDQPLASIHESSHSQELASNLLSIRTGPLTAAELHHHGVEHDRAGS